jgi:DNA repair protein RadD
MISLRPYQLDVVIKIREEFKTNRSVVCVVPTGGGKTIIFSYIAYSALQRDKRVLILVHRDNLLEQASGKLSEYGIPHGRIGGGRSRTNDKIQVASVQTLVRRLDKTPDPDLIIVDEGHHATLGTQWGRILEHYPRAKILGVTATPIRLDGKGLGVGHGGYYDSMVVGVNIQDLILEGFLSRPVTFHPPNMLNLEGVRKIAGDFSKSELAQRVGAAKITGDAIEHYRKLANGQPAIAFCISVAHAEQVAADFRAAGFNFVSIDGSMDRRKIYSTIRDLGSGNIDGITSCDLISEGTDVPVVACGIFLRPTQSTALYLQQAGRILRQSPGKEKSILLDHVGNSLRHGLPEKVRNWTLEGTPKRKRGEKAEEEISVTQCPTCFFVYDNSLFESCPNCGQVVEKKGRKIEQEEGELVQAQAIIDEEALEKKREIAKAWSYEEFLNIAKKRGYNLGWAKHMYQWKRGRK